MQFSKIFAAAGLAAVVYAQSQTSAAAPAANTPAISDIPTCALMCLVNYAPKVGCMNALDLPCQCGKFNELQTLVQPCVIASCKAVTDQLKTIRVTTGLCAYQRGLRGAAVTQAEDAAQTSIIVQLGTGPMNSALPTGTNAIAYGLYSTNMPTTFVPAGAAPTNAAMGGVGAALGAAVGLAAFAL